MTTNKNVIEMLKDVIGGEPTTEEPPTQTEGFDSLISEEEFKAILELKEAMDNFINIHNETALKFMEADMNSYQRIQVMMLGDKVHDAQQSILMMCGIHSCNKEFIDALAEDMGYTLKGLEKKLFENKLDRLFG